MRNGESKAVFTASAFIPNYQMGQMSSGLPEVHGPYNNNECSSFDAEISSALSVLSPGGSVSNNILIGASLGGAFVCLASLTCCGKRIRRKLVDERNRQKSRWWLITEKGHPAPPPAPQVEPILCPAGSQIHPQDSQKVKFRKRGFMSRSVNAYSMPSLLNLEVENYTTQPKVPSPLGAEEVENYNPQMPNVVSESQAELELLAKNQKRKRK